MNDNESAGVDSTSLKMELRKNPLFHHLGDQNFNDLLRSTRVVNYRCGEVIFLQDSEALSFYHVISGLIKLHRQSPDGQEKIFHLARPGRAFAEALISRQHHRYPVTATAVQDSTVIAIKIRDYANVLETSLDTGLAVISGLTQRLHELIAEIDHLSLMSGRSRLATYLLDNYLQKGSSFILEVPKKEIASLLALQPETFSRLLKELCDGRVVAAHGKEITILDDRQLRRKAGIL